MSNDTTMTLSTTVSTTLSALDRRRLLSEHPFSLSDRSTAVSAVLGLLLVLCIIACLGLNVIAIFVYAVSRKLRKHPHHYFLVSLAVGDVISGVLWTLPALVAASQWTWTAGDGFCQFHGVVWTVTLTSNIYTMALIIFEKCIRILWPSKHKDMFQRIVCVVLLCSLWIYSGVFGLFPLVGWGELIYFQSKFSCTYFHYRSLSHLNFFYITAYFLPVIFVAVMLILVAVKIVRSRRKINPQDDKVIQRETDKVVLEEKKDVAKVTYAEKMRKVNEKHKFDMRKNQKRVRKKDKENKKREAYETDSEDSGFDSEIDYVDDYEDYIQFKRLEQQKHKRRRVYYYNKYDIHLLLLFVLLWAVYTLLWLPFVIVSYTVAYRPQQTGYVGAGWLTFAALLTHFTTWYKPVVYVTNGYFRAKVVQSFRRTRLTEQEEQQRVTAVQTSTTRRTVVRRGSTYTIEDREAGPGTQDAAHAQGGADPAPAD